jgi:hypothetical protein
MVVFVWFFLPETKDRTLEEIDEMFHARVPARKFKSYVCAESVNARTAGFYKTEEKGVTEVIETGPE